MKTRSPVLTIIAIFYNGQREAARTLYTLSATYQRRVSAEQYRVVAIDNGSDKPLSAEMVRSLGENFSYIYEETDSPSPCATLNKAIQAVDTPYVMCIIDGAHMVSPGVLFYTLAALKNFDNPFVYTLALQLGAYQQNYLAALGYNQKKEDELLATVDWKKNGYELFNVSNFKTYRDGFFSKLNESNCFCIKTKTLLELGGFEEQFVSPGGGYVNLDVFKKIVEKADIDSVMLIGEASFHQFHGGVTTNKAIGDTKILEYREEYRRVRGEEFRMTHFLPHYTGHFPPECNEFFPRSILQSYKTIARRLVNRKEYDAALIVYKEVENLNKYSPLLYASMGNVYLKKGELNIAAAYYKKSIRLNPGYSANPYANLGQIYTQQKAYKKALEIYKEGLTVDKANPKIFFKIGETREQMNQPEEALKSIIRALSLSGKNPITVAFCVELSTWFYDKKMYNRSLMALNHGLEKHTENPQLHFKMAEVLVAKGENKAAAEAYQQAQKLGFRNIELIKNRLKRIKA